MLNNAIRLGDKLNIKQLDKKEHTVYPSKLLDIKDDVISIAMPIVKNQVIILDINTKYVVTFYTDKGLYSSEAIVSKRYKVKNIYVAELTVLGKLTKVQRRAYYRLHYIIEMKYSIVPIKEMTEVLRKINQSDSDYGMTEYQKKIRAINYLQDRDVENGTELVKLLNAFVIDISAGGLRFSTKEEVQKKTELYLIFSLDGGVNYYHLFGEVISSERFVNHSNLFENRLKFTGISAEEREAIVCFVLNEERKLRQKEKGFNKL